MKVTGHAGIKGSKQKLSLASSPGSMQYMTNFVCCLEMLLVVLALCVLQGDATYYSRSSKLIWT